jgi:glycosyltransferase involved in cell wall biosynthesis
MRPVTEASRHLLMTADAVGGVWTYALDLAGALWAHGTRTTLAVLGPGLGDAQRATAARIPGLALIETGLPLDWLAEDAAAVLRAGEAVAALAARIGADVVQLNSPALAAGCAFPVPVLGACHSCLATWWDAVKGGPMPEDFGWRTDLLAEGYAACDALVAPSAAFAAATARAYALDRPPEVVRNGRAAVAPAEGMAPFAFTAGRLWDEGKDLATLDRAAARLDMPVLAAGPLCGPHGGSVTLPHLTRLGMLDGAAVAAWLARGPVFVSAARYEPFGLAVLEAAQAGCALVLSDIPTFRELWNGAARFVAPGDDAGFAREVAELSRNREQRSALRVAAMLRSRDYTAEAMSDGIAALHAGLVGRRDAPGGRSMAA